MKLFQLYKSNTQGNVAIMFAGVMVLILLVASVAITTTQSHSNFKKLTDAADAAALAAVKAVSDEIGVLEEGDWEAEGQSVGRQVFVDNIDDINDLGQVDYDLVLTLGPNNRDVMADLTFSTTRTPLFSRLSGLDEVKISNTVSASKTLFKYSRINFLVDVSSSMAVGADSTNQDLLQNATGCALACHTDGSLALARNQGIRLRIDTIKNALTEMLSQLDEAQGLHDEFQVAIYTFSNSVEELLAPTSDLSDALSVVDSIEVASSDGQGGTNMAHSFGELNSILPRGRDGRRANQRQSYVVILTDGVENSGQFSGNDLVRDPNFIPVAPSEVFSDHEEIQGFDPWICQPLKTNQHIVAFLNPEYLLPSDRHNAFNRRKFSFIEDTLLSDISYHSGVCSTSTGYAYSAETEAEVDRATRELFNDLLGRAPRLSD